MAHKQDFISDKSVETQQLLKHIPGWFLRYGILITLSSLVFVLYCISYISFDQYVMHNARVIDSNTLVYQKDLILEKSQPTNVIVDKQAYNVQRCYHSHDRFFYIKLHPGSLSNYSTRFKDNFVKLEFVYKRSIFEIILMD